jgi:hypothetical protein
MILKYGSKILVLEMTHRTTENRANEVTTIFMGIARLDHEGDADVREKLIFQLL